MSVHMCFVVPQSHLRHCKLNVVHVHLCATLLTSSIVGFFDTLGDLGIRKKTPPKIVALQEHALPETTLGSQRHG